MFMVPILINNDVFEPTYKDLKLMFWNCDYICTNLIAYLNIQKTKIMASGPITSWETDGEIVETVSDLIFWAPKSLQMVTAAMKLKTLTPWKKSYDQPR